MPKLLKKSYASTPSCNIDKNPSGKYGDKTYDLCVLVENFPMLVQDCVFLKYKGTVKRQEKNKIELKRSEKKTKE